MGPIDILSIGLSLPNNWGNVTRNVSIMCSLDVSEWLFLIQKCAQIISALLCCSFLNEDGILLCVLDDDLAEDATGCSPLDDDLAEEAGGFSVLDNDLSEEAAGLPAACFTALEDAEWGVDAGVTVVVVDRCVTKIGCSLIMFQTFFMHLVTIMAYE